MLVVAGPPGSGKSRLFPIQRSGLDWFSVDDRCAELNGGSYQGIPPAVRARASRECEAFIRAHIETRRSFAVESTLRTRVAVEQARAARAQGFSTLMIFVATDDVETNVVRVAARGLGGGHSAPAERVREVYRSSLGNLAAAVAAFDQARVYDNSRDRVVPRLVATFRGGRLASQAADAPAWLARALDELTRRG
jgi:predicted ABC-type ATPase